MVRRHDSTVYAVVFLIVVGLATALAVFRPADRSEGVTPAAARPDDERASTRAEPAAPRPSER